MGNRERCGWQGRRAIPAGFCTAMNIRPVSMAVRSAVNVIPRDIFGVPVLELSLLLRYLPPRLADVISRPLVRIVEVDGGRFDDLRVSAGRQRSFGADGLYFCGYWVSPTGQIREIARDARKIVGDIVKRK